MVALFADVTPEIHFQDATRRTAASAVGFFFLNLESRTLVTHSGSRGKLVYFSNKKIFAILQKVPNPGFPLRFELEHDIAQSLTRKMREMPLGSVLSFVGGNQYGELIEIASDHLVLKGAEGYLHFVLIDDESFVQVPREMWRRRRKWRSSTWRSLRKIWRLNPDQGELEKHEKDITALGMSIMPDFD